MHQNHNIPWRVFGRHFKVNSNAQKPKDELIARRLPSQAQDLNHWVTQLISTIETFATTERAKHPTQIPPQTSGKIFSDDLKARYPLYLNSSNQSIQTWFSGTPFTSAYGALADVIKILIIEDNLHTVLMLCQHPRIPVHTLASLGWGHSFGFDHLTDCLRPYIYFNALDSLDLLSSGAYKSLASFQRLKRSLTVSMDFDAQRTPHLAFVNVHQGPGEGEEAWDKYEAVHGYLKTLFAILYRFEVLARECGARGYKRSSAMAWDALAVWVVTGWSDVKTEPAVPEDPYGCIRFAEYRMERLSQTTAGEKV